MKKFIIFLFILIFSLNLFSLSQNIEIAQKVAENFIRSKNQDRVITKFYSIKANEQNLVYIYNLSPAGFIAVSTDDGIYPVIAYSFHNCLFEEDSEQNLVYKMFLSDLKLRLNYYRNNPQKAKKNQSIWKRFINDEIEVTRPQYWPEQGTTPTSGWVETQWHQTGVFNDFCPLDNSGQRAVVGCVATAMAMIMDYYQYVGVEMFTDADDYSANGISIDDEHEERDFPSFPELNLYMNDLRMHYINDDYLTNQDKAAINFAAGISVNMYYSSQGSGAYTSDVATALVNKFNYANAEWVDNYGAEFYTQLIQNMMNAQPAEFSITHADGSGGHAIICDGYNTDDYYHLNFGWGTSNITCWYLLPEGMPSGYSVINGAVMEIEKGPDPLTVNGNVIIEGVSPEGTYITLEGERFFETYVSDESGDFVFPAIFSGTYTATAILERVYYESFEIELDSLNNFIQFNLGNYEALTGTVTAPIDPEGCFIALYQENEMVYNGITNSMGEYSIPDVLPGDYIAMASLAGNYFQMQEATITLENQVIDFDLDGYGGDLAFSYANCPVDILHLIPNYTMTCAIKLTPDEVSEFENDVLAKVRFKVPIEMTEGELYAQIWEGDDLLSEKEMTEFYEGEWLETAFDFFEPIDINTEYYIGYKIHTLNGDLVYHDNGPRIEGKGAFIRTGGWTELSSNLDYNFCIEPVIISQNFGTITGNVQLDGGDGNILDVTIKSENYIEHPNENGDYFSYLKPGIYDVSLSLKNYSTLHHSNTIVIPNENIELPDAVLTYLLGLEDAEMEILDSNLINNFPNPFHSTTTISFSVTQTSLFVTLEIFNIKGQKVRTLECSNCFAAASKELKHSKIWDGKDNEGNPVTSGLYFYQMNIDGKPVAMKKMLLVR